MSDLPARFQFDVIGIVHSPFREKFGIPRQPGLTRIPAVIELLPPYAVADAVKGLDAFSHIWISFVFHAIEREWKPLVRPPRLGGNEKIGVFASRATYRPNPLGLSVVALEKIETGSGVKLFVSGADLLDGTPVLDIKPYVPYVDSIANARAGFAPQPPQRLRVTWQPQALQKAKAISGDFCELVEDVLAYDPRPAYQNEPARIYGVLLADVNVRFRIGDSAVEIVDISD